MTFVWDHQYETGIDLVDRQHRALLDLINEVAPILIAPGPPASEAGERLLDRLFADAATHFKMEEELMAAHGIDPRHVHAHVAEHAHFIQRLAEVRAARGSISIYNPGPRLLAVLVHWSSFHMLDADLKMARQIELLAAGAPPALAYEQALLAPPSVLARDAFESALTEIYALLGECRRAAQEVRDLADTDQTTGLYNRSCFIEALNRAAAHTNDLRQTLALLLVELDESPGNLGDRLLESLARRLGLTARRDDLAARTGELGVALALVGGDDPATAAEACERVFAELSAPAQVEGKQIDFSLSGGIAVLPVDAGSGDHLLAAAELALRDARTQGGAHCRRYDESLGQPAHLRSEAIRALREAIRNNELLLHYQPQVSLHSGEIVGLEALVRWRHPTRGLVPPGQFIPLAEETGLVVPLGDWVLREAAAQVRAWRERGLPDIRVAVNLSARHFRQPGLPEELEALLREHGIAPHLFELELTESVMMHDPASAVQVVERLKEIGLKLSLDDFGTGYSSLAYLSRFAIDTVKIDQSFVRDITTNPVNASISVAMIAMAHKLGKSVIAEGVETESQMIYLRRHDCDEMQGYYFSRPLPADEVAEMLRSGRTQTFGELSVGEQPCILLVDDEPNILSALKRALRREGYRILTADGGPRALELLAANDVQVVLSDQRMPDMTGSELLGRVKDLYPTTVRLVLSGYSELSAVTDAINRGAIYKYLSKPWNDEELKQEVRQAFRHQKERQRPPA